jgi:hypothetical protein
MRIQRIEMMIVLLILWTIGLTFLITGIVLVAGDPGEKSRGARGHRFRY